MIQDSINSGETSTFSVNFLSAEGEMAERTRAYKWSRTALGTFDKWPQSLRTTLSIILHSNFPMFLWWGPDMIQFYNDAYRPSLGENGKHPDALGQHARECWPEIWDIIYPLIQQVQTTGKSFFIEDQLIPIFRNGAIEDVYWTFSYSAVIGETGGIDGVLVVCNETTRKIETLHEIEHSRQLLVESANNLRNTIMQAPVAMCILKGKDYIVEIANDRMIEFWGKSREEVLGRPAFEAVNEARNQGFEEILNNVFNSGETFSATGLPVKLLRDDKVETVYVNFVYEPFREGNGTISGVMAVASEVTAQVLAGKKIEASEARFRSLISAAPIGLVLFVGRDLVVDMPNKTYLDIAGKDESIIGKPLAEAMPELVGQPFLGILDNVYTTGKPYQTYATEAMLIKNGVMESIYYDFSYTPLFDEQGQVYAILDVALDVTEQVLSRRKANQQDEENRKLVSMVEASHDFIGLANLDTTAAYLNPAAMEMLGWDDFKGKAIIDCVYPPDKKLAANLLAKLVDKGSFSHEIRFLNTLTNEPFWIQWNAFIVKDAFGNLTTLATVSPNVTERKKAELKVVESEERFRIMAEGSEILIAVSDETSNVTYFNKAWVQLTGRPLEELQDFGWADQIHEEDREAFLNVYLTAFSKKETFNGEFRILNSNGEYRWLLANGPPRFRPDGSFAGYISSCIDITERKQTEVALKKNEQYLEQLVRERTAELERSNEDLLQFAHVASHDLKEPIRKIRTYHNRLKGELGTDLPPRARVFLDKVESATDRVYSMIDGVLNYSSLNSLQENFEPVSLLDIITSIETDLEVLIAQKSATIKTDTLPVIEGSLVLLYQLFYNLINNSLKFTRPNEDAVISILSDTVNSSGQDFVRVVLVDNGIGFEAEFGEKIFNPFMRLNSKDRFEGTGLGLALCKKIVERHKGSITATGEKDRGARFTIFLPVKQNY